MAVSPGYSDHGVRVVLEALEKASRQQSDDSTEDLVFGNVAKLALDIHQRCRVPKLDPLVAISCDAAYAGIYYAERTLQQKEVEVNPQLLEETQAKLDRLAG
ncbi:hypothetical protein PQX77_001527 [Marasmius sp. AFHP31]|nr:hypothetical protein PQX77_001527 [Marasmius sp. AFHP31]